jgi:hypothetical protein
MADKWTTTTADPELLGITGTRGETPKESPGPSERTQPGADPGACLSNPKQTAATQQPGGAGAPGTGSESSGPHPTVTDDGP